MKKSYPQPSNGSSVLHLPCFILEIVAFCSLVSLRNLPKFDGLVVGGQEKVGRVLSPKPPDLVDLLLNFQGLEVIKLWLMTLEGAVNIVLPPFRY